MSLHVNITEFPTANSISEFPCILTPETAEFILVNFANGIATVGETVSQLGEIPCIDENSCIKLNNFIREINTERTKIFSEITKELVATHSVVIEHIGMYNKLREENPSLPGMPYVFVVINNYDQLIESLSSDSTKELVNCVDFITRVCRSTGINVLSANEIVKAYL